MRDREASLFHEQRCLRGRLGMQLWERTPGVLSAGHWYGGVWTTWLQLIVGNQLDNLQIEEAVYVTVDKSQKFG